MATGAPIEEQFLARVRISGGDVDDAGQALDLLLEFGGSGLAESGPEPGRQAGGLVAGEGLEATGDVDRDGCDGDRAGVNGPEELEGPGGAGGECAEGGTADVGWKGRESRDEVRANARLVEGLKRPEGGAAEVGRFGIAYQRQESGEREVLSGFAEDLDELEPARGLGFFVLDLLDGLLDGGGVAASDADQDRVRPSLFHGIDQFGREPG